MWRAAHAPPTWRLTGVKATAAAAAHTYSYLGPRTAEAARAELVRGRGGAYCHPLSVASLGAAWAASTVGGCMATETLTHGRTQSVQGNTLAMAAPRATHSRTRAAHRPAHHGTRSHTDQSDLLPRPPTCCCCLHLLISTCSYSHILTHIYCYFSQAFTPSASAADTFFCCASSSQSSCSRSCSADFVNLF